MKLKTTKRGSGLAAEKMPRTEDIKNAIEVSTQPESADYLLDQIEKKISSGGQEFLKKCARVLETIKEFVANTHHQYDARNDPWTGNTAVKTDFQNLQQNLAKDSANTIIEFAKGSAIKIDYAVNDLAQLLRGYSLDGQPLDDKLVDALDKLFNAWLSEKNLISKDGVIYEANANGEIIKDQNGNSLRANAERVKDLINDPEQGFTSSLQSKNIEAVTQKHNYPVEKKPEAQKPSVQAAMKEELSTRVAAETKETVTTPQSGSGMKG